MSAGVVATRLCDESRVVAKLYTATRCMALRRGEAWRGVARPAGWAACAALWGDGVGSARQAFFSAYAFNQNIGSWNTASVTTMAQACALVPSHTCGAHPKIFVQQWSRPRVVPAQMWGWPTSDVGESRRRCGRVQVVTCCKIHRKYTTDLLFPLPKSSFGEHKMAQFRTHDLTKELSYVSTQQSGYFPIDTEMISQKCVQLA